MISAFLKLLKDLEPLEPHYYAKSLAAAQTYQEKFNIVKKATYAANSKELRDHDNDQAHEICHRIWKLGLDIQARFYLSVEAESDEQALLWRKKLVEPALIKQETEMIEDQKNGTYFEKDYLQPILANIDQDEFNRLLPQLLSKNQTSNQQKQIVALTLEIMPKRTFKVHLVDSEVSATATGAGELKVDSLSFAASYASLLAESKLPLTSAQYQKFEKDRADLIREFEL